MFVIYKLHIVVHIYDSLQIFQTFIEDASFYSVLSLTSFLSAYIVLETCLLYTSDAADE